MQRRSGSSGPRQRILVALLMLMLVPSLASAQALAEVAGLQWCAGTKDCLEWQPVTEATAYALYRGTLSDLPRLRDSRLDSRHVGDFAATSSGGVLAATPGADRLHWFLVSAVNESGEGTVGDMSEGPRELDAIGPCREPVVFFDDFAGSDGDAWPAGWTERGGVAVADIQAGRGRLSSVLSNYSLARVAVPLDESDVEVTFTLSFEDVATQGVGFYVRANGGYLQQTVPRGQGYAVFIEGFRGDAIGVWKEENGVESSLRILFDPALDLQDGIPYRVRFRCHQASPTTTMLKARIWRDGSPEPTSWHVEHEDDTAVLQNIGGSIGVDSWSNLTAPAGSPAPSHTFIDDIRMTRLCNPLRGLGARVTHGEAFTFTEGPLWRDDALLFTDLGTATIHRLVPPGTVEVFRAPSDLANGLATDVNGDLLAAEHGPRRVSRTDASDAVTSVVDRYQGLRFNSPNDLAVRSDGTIYFTDPPYGLPAPTDRELPFNGLFRLAPDGTLDAEWEGDAAASGPNGVSLSPDELTLYLADSAAGTITAWDVAPDGALSGARMLAGGMNTPDGTCVDAHGRIFVATWASTVEVVGADGYRWGRIPVPRRATNCAFGGDDARTLFITAHEGVYSHAVADPGLP